MNILKIISHMIASGVLFLCLVGGLLYGSDDFNITQSKISSMGTTITHEPKRSPVGEYITITIRKEGYDFSKAWYKVLFDTNTTRPIESKDVVIIDTQIGKMQLKAKVPKIKNMPSFHLAKYVDVMVVVKNQNGTQMNIITHQFMLSSRPLAVVFWLLALFVPWGIAGYFMRKVKKQSNGYIFNPIWFVTSYDGRASLSLAQVLVWTMLIFSASFYILEVSGKLLDFTDDVLILLGLTGGTSLITKIMAIDAKNSLHKNSVDLPYRYTPKWSHLFQSDGRADLHRVQMVLFTILAVVFVTGQIYAELVFPKFPEGLLALIGISNGVYLGAKIKQS